MNEPFFNLLHREHEEVMRVFQDFEITQHNRTETVNDRWSSLKRLLVPHMVAEENAFYPVLNDKPETQEDSQRALEQHNAAESVLFEINNLPVQGLNDLFWTRLNTLKSMVQDHVRFEEGTVFPKTAKVLSADQLQDIMQKYQQAEQDAKNSMAAPGTARQGT